jgi:hypothetical protein
MAQGQSRIGNAKVNEKQPVAPPVYRPQPVPKVLQAKIVVPNQPANQARRAPAAPPAYRPQPVPKVLQAKLPATPQPANRSNHVPVAPPVYRPQPAPKGLQPKMAGGQQSHAGKVRFPNPYSTRSTIQRALLSNKSAPTPSLDPVALANLRNAEAGDTLIGIMNHNTGEIFLQQTGESRVQPAAFHGEQPTRLRTRDELNQVPNPVNHLVMARFYGRRTNADEGDFVGFRITVRRDETGVDYGYRSNSLNTDFNRAFTDDGPQTNNRVLDPDLQRIIEPCINAAYASRARSEISESISISIAPELPPQPGYLSQAFDLGTTVVKTILTPITWPLGKLYDWYMS